MKELYNYIFVEPSAPLTREWPLISSPIPLILIISGYMYFVLYIGPHHMTHRPPYKLKTFILIYNFIQILANLWLIKEHITYGWYTEYSFICTEPISDSPKTIKVFNSLWRVFLLKIFDLVETCVFVLRKKQNQVSTLHVYHHVSNIVFGWIFLKYILEERASLLSLINCAVHVIMYIYYFIAALSPKYQQIISPIKPFITKIQMVQFLAMLLYMLQFHHPACKIEFKFNTNFHSTYILTYIFIGNLLLFLYLFYNFYKKSYTNMKKEK